MFDAETASPEEIYDALDRQAERFETPCGDGTLAWRAWGEGVPLLMIHGANGSWAHWIRNIPGLSRHRRLLIPDLPGYGDSAPVEGLETGDDIAVILEDGLRRLPFAFPIDIVAFSMGSTVAAHLAIRAPDLVRRLIIVDAGGLGVPAVWLEMRRKTGLPPQERLEANRENLLKLMLHEPSAVDDLAIYLQEHRTTKGCFNPGAMILPDKLVQVLPQVDKQVDVIWGEFDSPHPDPQAHLEAVRKSHPDAQLKVIEGAGHWSMYEGADAFNAAVLAYLAEPLRPR